MRGLRRAGLGVLIAALGLPTSASAQSLSPMRGEVAAYAETGSLRLTVGNPGTARMTVTVSVHEADWIPLEGAMATRTRLRLAPGRSSSVLVSVPVGPEARAFRVCMTSVPTSTGGGQAVRGQVCGRYAARRAS